MKVEIKRVSSSEENVSQRHVSFDLYVDGKYKATYNDVVEAMAAKEKLEKGGAFQNEGASGTVMYESPNWKIVKQENPQQFILYEMPGKKEKGVFKTLASAREVIGRSPSFQNGVAKAEAYICSKMGNATKIVERHRGYKIAQDAKGLFYVVGGIGYTALSDISLDMLKKRMEKVIDGYYKTDRVLAGLTNSKMANVGGSQYIKREKLLQLLKDGYIQIEHGDAQNGRPGSGVTVRWRSGKIQNYILED